MDASALLLPLLCILAAPLVISLATQGFRNDLKQTRYNRAIFFLPKPRKGGTGTGNVIQYTNKSRDPEPYCAHSERATQPSGKPTAHKLSSHPKAAMSCRDGLQRVEDTKTDF